MECTRLLLSVCLAGAGLWGADARADDYVTCESRNDRYQSCSITTAGYVTLDRQLSSTSCTQGRTWDYNRREIWVDDGCRATFRVHTSSSGHHGDDHDAKVAAGVLIGAAILGAIAHNANKKDDKYDDDRYQGARHSSYVPSWMIGTFEGYNAVYDRGWPRHGPHARPDGRRLDQRRPAQRGEYRVRHRPVAGWPGDHAGRRSPEPLQEPETAAPPLQ